MQYLRWMIYWTSLLLYTASGYAQPALLSVYFQHADLRQVLQALASYQQRNIVVASNIKQTIDIQLTQVSWQQAFSTIINLYHLSVSHYQQTLLVELADEHSPSLTKRQTQVIHLHYAAAETVVEALKKSGLLDSSQQVNLIARTNSLLLRATAEQLTTLRRWIDEFDQPQAQVQLSAHIVTISRERLRELGVHWGLTDALPSTNSDLEQLAIDLAVPNASSRFGFRLAKLNHRLLNLELTALEQENQAQIIASPHLFTANQQTASIKQGTEIPYQVSSGSTGATALEFKEAVLGMQVTPTILANGKITLKLLISQNIPGPVLQQGHQQAVSIDKQEIQTQVTVNNGDTVVLGGIFQQQQQQKQHQVPWLHQLPLVGHLFRYQQQQQQRRELVIFITPQLINS